MSQMVLHKENRLQKSLFVIGQIAGWGLFFLFNLLVQAYVHGFQKEDVVATSLLVFWGIFWTSVYRSIIKRRKKRSRKILLLIPLVLLVSMLLAGLITFCGLYSISLYSYLFYPVVFVPDAPGIVRNFVNLEMIVLLWMVGYAGGQYFLGMQQGKNQRLALESSLKDAQLNVLKGQINPHFMFNSMNNIRALMLEDVSRAREMITRLSEMLRYSLNSSQNKKVTLGEELEILSHFVALATIQLEDRLHFTLNCDAELHRFLLPPMIVQMLAENAIKHGIGKLREGGELLVEIQANEETLEVLVSNSGRISHDSHGTQIGLENIAQRLHLLYGDSASFRLEEKEAKVCARLSLPLEEA